MRQYTFSIFRFVKPDNNGLNHYEIATYDGLDAPPWVPPHGSFFRFRDPQPPFHWTRDPSSAGSPPDHPEVTGYVDQVVTVFYGTRTTIEIYLKAESQ